MAPKQFLQAGSGVAIPLDRTGEFDRRVDDRLTRRLIVFAAPRDPAIYGANVHDFYIRCSCGWWSLPYVAMPPPREIRCKACAERESGVDNFTLFMTSAQWGCYPVKEIELAGVASVAAGV